MHKHLYIALSLLLLLPSCGVKKPAAVTEQAIAENSVSENSVSENSVAEPAAVTIVQDSIGQAIQDTLPDFLKEFANDSTIHINWAYGIPFIIDDSVPMLLPPIDKNPEGYVSRNFAGIGYNWLKNREVLGLYSPMDSILWLNKCIHDTYDYIMSNMVVIPSSFTYDYNWVGSTDSISNAFFDTSHVYFYVVKLISMNGRYCFQILFEQEQEGMQSPELANYFISYFFDIEGTLLGKMHVKKPKYWFRPHLESVIYLRASIPDYDLFTSKYFAKFKSIRLFSFIIKPFGPTEE